MRSTRVWLLGLSLIAACSEATDEEIIEEQPRTWENKAPLLHVAAPGALSVGEYLEIIGQDFIQPDHGSPKVQLKGNYADDQGGTQPVELEVKPECVRSGSVACGKLRWRLWPDIVFSRTGDRLGYFQGTVVVVNVGNDGSSKASDPLSVQVEVKPSLIPRVIKPKDGNCEALVSATLEDTPFIMTVEAIGLREATMDSPLVFSWAFLRQQWNVSFGFNTMDPNSILPESGAMVLEEKVTSGTTSSAMDSGQSNFLIKFGTDVFGPGKGQLSVLKTGKVPAAGEEMTAMVNVGVVDGTGKQVSLSIPLSVTRAASMTYDGNNQLAERFAPVKVSDCMPGGDFTKSVSYSENESESHSRNMSFSYNAGVSVGAGLSIYGIGVNINFSTGFGVDTSASASSSKSNGLDISGQVLPGQYGVFYRQTSKWYRTGKLFGHNVCGNIIPLGDVVLTDWTFTPELATGTKCIPPSRLPPAEKFLPEPTGSSMPG